MKHGLALSTPELDLDAVSEMPLVSIIVPTYNTPKSRLTRCVGSLIGQTYPNVEVIIVDDGSDTPYKKSLSRLAVDSRIIIVESGHAGVSHARNVGIERANGSWIAFADADDEVVPGFVEEALRVAKAEGVDFVCGAVCGMYEGGVVKNDSHDDTYYIVDDAYSLESAAMQMLGPVKYRRFKGPDFRNRGPVANLYRSSVIERLRFDESIAIGEDTLFNYRFIRQCNSMAIVDRVWYHYYQYAGSAVHSANPVPWKSSIGGLLASCADGEDPSPFVSRCAFMAFQGVDAFAQDVGMLASYRPSMNLLRYARSKGCFDSNILDEFDPARATSIKAILCQRGHLGAAWIFMALNAKRRKILLPLIASGEDEVQAH